MGEVRVASSSGGIVFLEQARRARDRMHRLRALARGINAPDVVEQLTALACELEESAAELEEIASTVVSGVARTESLSSEIGNAVERGKELVARLKKRLGDRQT